MSVKTSRFSVLVASACTIFWPGALIFAFPGILRQHWQLVLNAGGSAVGRSVFFVLTGATCFMYPCGRWLEKYGPRRLIIFGSMLCGISTLWVSQADSMADVNIWAFFVGASTAFIYLSGLTVVQRWYPEKRGLVSGFFNMAFGLSAAVMSPIFTTLLSKWGYEALTLIAGSSALIFGLTASYLICFPKIESLASSPGTQLASSGRTVMSALKSKAFWGLWFTWVFAGAAGASMLVLATGFGLARGLSLAHAVIILTAFNLTNGCGRLISGYLSDQIGRSRTMVISFVCAGLAYLVMPHSTDLWLWTVMAALIGFAFGTLFAVSGPLAIDCFGMAHFGAIFGLVFTAYGFASGPLGPWLSGYLLDITHGNYTVVFSYLGMMYLGAGGSILFVRPLKECGM